MSTQIINRAGPGHIALETTLLVHGLPGQDAAALAGELGRIAAGAGAPAATIGVLGGRAIVGMTEGELSELLAAADVPKANSANLGVLIHRGGHAATTVSATLELAAACGVRLFATGGIGGVHRGYGEDLDISSDLTALSRFPVAVVSSGVKSILDVIATREALETLGVPVIGFGTDSFPAFYLRQSEAGVDARFDDVAELAAFVDAELARTGRGVLIANPIPEDAELNEDDWERWLEMAAREADAQAIRGRDRTPFILGRLHEISDGATLRANIALVKSNVHLAAAICSAM